MHNTDIFADTGQTGSFRSYSISAYCESAAFFVVYRNNENHRVQHWNVKYRREAQRPPKSPSLVGASLDTHPYLYSPGCHWPPTWLPRVLQEMFGCQPKNSLQPGELGDPLPPSSQPQGCITQRRCEVACTPQTGRQAAWDQTFPHITRTGSTGDTLHKLLSR